jgi:SCY1-like protein 2
VQREHDQFLRDAQRIEDRSATAVNGVGQPLPVTVDFESLVGRQGTGGTNVQNSAATDAPSWDDDVWNSIFTDNVCIY